MSKNYDPAIDGFIEKVVQSGSHYRMEAMDGLYTQDQSILFVRGDGTVTRAPRAAMMEEFAARGDAGEPPLSMEHRVLHIEQQGDTATAILYRRMSPLHPAAMYELRLRRESDAWMIAGETVIAWPKPQDADDFLPPRTR